MVITFMILHTGLVVVFDDLRICCVDDMSAVAGEDTVVLKPVRCLRERGGKLVEQVLESGRKYLLSPLDKGRWGRDAVHIHVEVSDQFIR